MSIKHEESPWDLVPRIIISSNIMTISNFFIQMAAGYDHLTLMQKVEVFEHALSNTNGDDLAKVLWLKSPSSEVGLVFRL